MSFTLTLLSARTIPHPSSSRTDTSETADLGDVEPAALTLSLYIAALSFESSVLDFSYVRSIFVGIKPIKCGAGSRFAETKWAWSISRETLFCQESELWEVQLPLLSSLLDQANFAQDDSFSLVVQIAPPPTTGSSFTLPGRRIVPRSIIDGMGGLLDTQTGDVRFVCLEHRQMPALDDATSDASQRATQTLSRKRVLYAHSVVLRARGEYFDGLLSGGFSEGDQARRTESRCTTLLVDDASFDTVYWMLR